MSLPIQYHYDACDDCGRVTATRDLAYCANCGCKVCENCLNIGDDGRNLCGNCFSEQLLKDCENEGGSLYE